MKYKIGDLVRVIKKDGNDKYEIGEIFEVGRIECEGSEQKLCIPVGGYFLYRVSDLEPVTHLTTAEFIKLVEDMGYNGKIRIGNMVVTYGESMVGYINEKYVNRLGTDFYEEVRNSLMKVMVLYANTPPELREDKEQLYTLELPGNICESDKYYNLKEGKYFFGTKDNRLTNYKTRFTQKEIDELPNQELIKVLVKREVKEEEQ